MPPSLLAIGFDGLTLGDEARALLRAGVRTVVLFARNYESPAQLRDLCAEIHACGDADDPVLVAVDHEGGRVQRFRAGFSAIPPMREVGAAGSEAEAERLGALMGRELAAVGIDLDFAPVMDVDTNPANPVIAERSFGRDPDLVARMGAALIRGLHAGGVAACAKHFPGHGDTHLDSHLALPRLPHGLERIERLELPPFRAAIAADVDSIMTAHVVLEALDPGRPATLSPAIVEGLLRRRLGFDGLVFSDDLEMKAIADHFGFAESCVAAVAAGCDLLLVCSDPARQHAAIEALGRWGAPPATVAASRRRRIAACRRR